MGIPFALKILLIVQRKGGGGFGVPALKRHPSFGHQAQQHCVHKGCSNIGNAEPMLNIDENNSSGRREKFTREAD